MAGGVWLSQNKTRPGAYINFVGVAKPSMTVGDRGVVAIPLALSWGATGELISVLSTELADGSSRKKVGFDAMDEKAKLLAGALSYCYKALVYRTNTGALKASAILGGLKATAKYGGTFGNKIIVATESENGLYIVTTYIEGETVDTQKVSAISELENNDYVDFSQEVQSKQDETSGEVISTPIETISLTAGTALTGGTDGVVIEDYAPFLRQLRMSFWQTMVCFSNEVLVKKNICNFIKQLRDDEGRYVQGVVVDYDGADSEGIINSVSGAVIDGLEYSQTDFAAVVAGLCAGANFNESNTAREIKGATKIIGEMTDEEIKTALKNGKFLLSVARKGKIKVEQDINSLHTFTKTKGYVFSKNRVIRTLDEIGTSTAITWEETYMGKVDNDPNNRSLFKSDLVEYGRELENKGGIHDFAGNDDIKISQGNNIDSIYVEWNVAPTDSMEKLYMQVNVKG